MSMTVNYGSASKLVKLLRRFIGSRRGSNRLAGAPTAGRNVSCVPDDIQASLNESGIVFVSLRKGVVYKANRAGAMIWQRLILENNPIALIEDMVRVYGLPQWQIEQDAAAFIADLRHHGLLMKAEAP
jgi:hypothetical protein